jgi:hypothetical protein
VAAVGSDGYTAVVFYGETDPNFGNRAVVVSVSEDNKPLDTVGPRLVVPGDVKGGRYVTGVVRLIVGRAQP